MCECLEKLLYFLVKNSSLTQMSTMKSALTVMINMLALKGSQSAQESKSKLYLESV